MPETDYYESYRRKDNRDVVYADGDDDRYKKTTVRRYKVGNDRVERIDTTDRYYDDDSRRSRRSSNTLLDVNVNRRDYVPERPRSAFEVSEVSTRSERDRSGRLVYDRERDVDRDGYMRVQKRGERDDQIVVETFSEDRRDDGYGGQIERFYKETEYYEPASPSAAPIVIRNRPAEQKIILQEAPAPPPLVIPPYRQQPGVIVLREKNRHKDKGESRRDDDYYYERRERHEVGPYRGDERREEDLAVERYERHDEPDDHARPHHHRHHRRDRRDYASDGDYTTDDEFYVKKTTIIRRKPSRSPSNHRLHLAEGALAGAGIGALMGSRRSNQTGELSEHRGRKVLAGAALGALGTEALKRAHSMYNERYGDNDREDDRGGRAHSRGSGDDNRSPSPSHHHSKLKTGLGLAAAALAVAGAAKYMQSTRIDKEERNRGRSRHRHTSDEDSYDRYDDDHYDDDRDERRDRRDRRDHRDHRSYSRSHLRSRSRSAPPPADTSRSAPYPPSNADQELGLVEYGAQPVYSDPAYAGHQGASMSRRGSYDSATEASDAESRRRHRQHDRSRRRNSHDDSDDLGYADAEDSGRKPKQTRSRSRLRDPAVAGAGAAAAAVGLKTYHDKKQKDAAEKESRDHDRDRDRDRDRDHDRDRDYDRDRGYDSDDDRRYDRYGRHGRSSSRGASRHRDENQRNRDDGNAYDGYYDDYDHNRPPSPPHASGGTFYPPAPPMGSTGNVMQHPNTNLNEAYPPYNPADYSGYPPPPGPPPNTTSSAQAAPPDAPPAPSASAAQAADPATVPRAAVSGGPPPANADNTSAPRGAPADSPAMNSRPQEPGNGDPVSQAASSCPSRKETVNDHTRPQSPSHGLAEVASPKTVGFAPLSPQSSQTLQRHHAESTTHDDSRDMDDDQSLALRDRATERTPDALVSTSQGSDSGDDVEELPNRFDAQGHPLDGKSEDSHNRHGHSPLTSRHGDFEYKDPRRDDGWHVRGQWGVVGNDPAEVENITEGVRTVIDGFGRGVGPGLLGLVGGVLGGLASGSGHGEDGRRLEDEDDDSHRRSQRQRSTNSVEDDRKRKRRNTTSLVNHPDAVVRSGRHWSQPGSRDRASSVNSYMNGRVVDEDRDDGRDTRKKRRSWGD